MAFKRTDSQRGRKTKQTPVKQTVGSTAGKVPTNRVDDTIWQSPYAAKNPRQPFKTQYPAYSAQHPINSQANHELLLMFVKSRMDLANENRDETVNRYQYIDQELAGFLKLDTEDKKREKDYRKGLSSKPVDQKIQFATTQLEDMETYLMSVFAPDSGIFEALATKGAQPVANAFALKLNKDGERMGYYAEIALGVKNMLKYDLGGWTVGWDILKGKKLENAGGGMLPQKLDAVWQGNRIRSVDTYNLLYDPSVPPQLLNTRGEFFATIECHRTFAVERMLDNGEITCGQRFLESGENSIIYYRSKPNIRPDDFSHTSNGTTNVDWVSIMSAGGTGDAAKGYEFQYYYGWIRPARFGISDSNALEIYKLTFVGMKWLVACERLDNGHCMLPITLARPSNDMLGMQQKSIAEMLIPLQRFASYLFNLHQRASRKSLYGLLFYVNRLVPLGDHLKDDLESAQIPVNLDNTDRKISDMVQSVNNAPDTNNIMTQINSVLQLMQHMLPTNIQQMMSNLDRATQYQAAAVAQGANKKNLKIAKIINDHAFTSLRFMVMWNFMEKQQTVTMIGPDGNPVKLNAAELRDTEIEFAISDGLKGIDRLALMANYNELYAKLTQTPGASEEIDLLSVLNYISSLMGDKTDLTQFRKATGVDQIPAELQQQIMTLFQSGELDALLKSNLYVKKQQQKQAAQIAALITQTDGNLPTPGVNQQPGQDPSAVGQASQLPGPQPGPGNGPMDAMMGALNGVSGGSQVAQ